MSRDDSIVVVFFNGLWYVYHLVGEYWIFAITHGHAYKTQKAAMEAAQEYNAEFHTEYGICVYKPSDQTICEQLDTVYRFKPDFANKSTDLLLLYKCGRKAALCDSEH